jgi:hypothetical protein
VLCLVGFFILRVTPRPFGLGFSPVTQCHVLNLLWNQRVATVACPPGWSRGD